MRGGGVLRVVARCSGRRRPSLSAVQGGRNTSEACRSEPPRARIRRPGLRIWAPGAWRRRGRVSLVRVPVRISAVSNRCSAVVPVRAATARHSRPRPAGVQGAAIRTCLPVGIAVAVEDDGVGLAKSRLAGCEGAAVPHQVGCHRAWRDAYQRPGAPRQRLLQEAQGGTPSPSRPARDGDCARRPACPLRGFCHAELHWANIAQSRRLRLAAACAAPSWTRALRPTPIHKQVPLLREKQDQAPPDCAG